MKECDHKNVSKKMLKDGVSYDLKCDDCGCNIGGAYRMSDEVWEEEQKRHIEWGSPPD